MITPRPSPNDHTPKPGFPMRPFFGIEPVLVDEKVYMYTCTFVNFVNLYIHVHVPLHKKSLSLKLLYMYTYNT